MNVHTSVENHICREQKSRQTPTKDTQFTSISKQKDDFRAAKGRDNEKYM